MMQWLMYVLLLGGCIVAWRKTADLLNPVTIVGGTFFLPMIIATEQLSWLQRDHWAYETNISLILTWVAWFFVPVVLLFSSRWDRIQLQRYSIAIDTTGLWVIRIAAATFLLLFLLENYLLTGAVVPAANGLAAQDNIHIGRVYLLYLITRNGRIFATLLGIAFAVRKNYADLLLAVVVVLVPVSRLARIDLIPASLCFILIIYYLQNRSRQILKRAIYAGLALAIVFVVFGNMRASHLGKYEISYADSIGYHGLRGPGEIFAWLYGYFPLSFENYDRFVRNVEPGAHTYGLYTLRPLILGLTQLDAYIPGYPDEAYEAGWGNPLAPQATVATALRQFYLDFGPVFIMIPLLLYIGLLLYLYRAKSRNLYGTVAYVLLVSSFAMSGFQNWLTAPDGLYAVLGTMAMIRLTIRFERHQWADSVSNLPSPQT